MRNIRIADPRDRVTPIPAPVPATRHRRLRDWLATIPIVLLVPALALPFMGTAAAGPTITVSPDTVAAGASVRLNASGFPARSRGVVAFDAPGLTVTFKANASGAFRIRVTIPAGATAGAHVLTATTTAGPAATATATLMVKAQLGGSDPAPNPTPPSDGTAPTNAPTVAPTIAPTAVPTVAPTLAPTPVPTTPPTAAPTPGATPAPVPATGAVLLSAGQLAALPTSGAAWTALKARADASAASPNIANQDDNTDLTVLAKGLVYARTGTATYRTGALVAIKAAVGTEAGGRTLALGRNLPGYVIAADLISLRTLDPAYDQDVFRPWLRSLLTMNLDGRTLRSTHEDRPNNWGTHAGASRAAIAAYLGDATEMARVATVFRGYLGDRSAYAGFTYGDLAWQCDPAKPVGINPTGCSRDGIVLDGALPEEMRRGGALTWPPTYTDYAWEGLQGAMLQAEILARHGYDAWSWSNKALLRAARFLYERAGWPAVGDDEWQPWLLDARYGTSYRDAAPARTGKNFGYTDWLFPS